MWEENGEMKGCFKLVEGGYECYQGILYYILTYPISFSYLMLEFKHFPGQNSTISPIKPSILYPNPNFPTQNPHFQNFPLPVPPNPLLNAFSTNTNDVSELKPAWACGTSDDIPSQ